jgi:hypothetical protein
MSFPHAERRSPATCHEKVVCVNDRDHGVNKLYCFETWAQQSLDFLDSFAGEPAFIVCNSVGGEPFFKNAAASFSQNIHCLVKRS